MVKWARLFIYLKFFLSLFFIYVIIDVVYTSHYFSPITMFTIELTIWVVSHFLN